MHIYNQILVKKNSGKKQLAVLIDPDKVNERSVAMLCDESVKAGVDYFFVGGSLITHGDIHQTIKHIKSHCTIPVILFPGSVQQIDANADALLFLSLISGRNAELLIGHHVMAAPLVKQLNIETIPTGYLLIESGIKTTVEYISNTTPIPANKPEIAAATALAGELLGMKLIFVEAGSGATYPVSEKTIEIIKSQITVPLIIGGGIKTIEKAAANCKAGADLIVIGNSIEQDITLIQRFAEAVHTAV